MQQGVRVALLFCLCLPLLHAYKIAIFAPYMANSQILWNKRVGEELLKAGHNVTIYAIHMLEHENPKVNIDPRITIVPVNASLGDNGTEIAEMQSHMAFKSLPMWDPKMRAMFSRMSSMWKGCQVWISNRELMKSIEDQHFDLAFTHMYNFCGIGVIHATRIPTWIWLNSGALMDNVAELMGVPLPPSYCTPMMMDAGDRLSFLERVKSFVGHTIFKFTWKKLIADEETAIFRKEFGDDFPDVIDLARKAPLVMVNSNDLYDFARPTLSKVINIGGVGIKHGNAQPLTGEFKKLTEAAKDGIVVMSFGSVAPMYLMPEEWRDAYFHAFEQFPDIQFFLRYEKPEEIQEQLPKNAFALKWLPQTDLLQHEKALALLTHGGYNSIQDAIHAGIPLVASGLFGDQFRNAHLVEKLGFGINVPKTNVTRDSITEALGRVIREKRFSKAAKDLQAMVMSQPVSAETLLVKWTEFLAKHKNLDNLTPAGSHLNIFVYHSIDVISFLVVVIATVLFLIYSVLRCVLTCCGRCRRKEKTQ